jgi:16S rRNA processing protein RimM
VAAADEPDEVLLEVGRIDRAHGLQGEVVVTLITNVTERVAPGTVLSTDRGEMVVAASRPHQHRWIVAFEGVSTREGADALRGTVLRAAPMVDDDPDALWAHQVVGAAVVDVDGGEHGSVVALIDNPAADLLELDSGALVPLTFVIGWDDRERLVVDPPVGLFDDAG